MRPLIAEIRLDYLQHNYKIARQLHGGRVLAAVKANAYGHGAVACAQALVGLADGFAVACLEEALVLRHAGIGAPILLLEGVFDPAELAEVSAHDLWIVVHNHEQLAMIIESTPSLPYRIWLKMDSGMHRAGFMPEEFQIAYQRLAKSARVASIVLMTHFSHADSVTKPTTAAQMKVFDRATRGMAAPVSLANSAGILAHASARRDWGRVGIMMYGLSPMTEGWPAAQSPALKPVMGLKSRIFSVCHLAAGETVGYGNTFVSACPTRVGLVACGYADGYPRLAGTGSPVAVAGTRTRVIGGISMDMMTVDLNHVPDARVGSEVELWGETISVSEIAAHAGTIPYEVLCNVKRAHPQYRTS